MAVSGNSPFRPHQPPRMRSRRRRSARIIPCRPRLEGLETRELPSANPAAAGQFQQVYSQVPLSFEANQGQAEAPVKFLAHGQGYSLFLTPADAVLDLSRPAPLSQPSPPSGEGGVRGTAATVDSTLDIRLIDANAAPQVAGVDQLAGVSNYFIGNNPRQWHTNVPTYAQVAYRDVYPGVDLVYYGNQQQLEYDFNLAPGADPSAIRLAFDGAQDVTLDPAGNLVVQLAGGTVVEHAPVLYQWGAGGKEPVAGRYVLEGNYQAGFAVGAYDPSRELVIDPTLAYSTYLGGTFFDVGQGIAVDGAGDAYVTGYTYSADFPTTAGALQSNLNGGRSAFITKLNPTGTALVYSTYIGGSLIDFGAGIAVDGSGNAYITGSTNSPDFPTTAGAFQTTLKGSQGAFVTKLNAAGTALVYSSYVSGSDSDEATAIALDTGGNAYITGDTTSADFPTTVGALQTASQSMGQPTGFVTKLNAGGTALAYSTYLGGSSVDKGAGIAVDRSGNAYVTGSTSSPDFPTTVGAFQTTPPGPNSAFVAKLNAGGTALVYSTYLGGNNSDAGTGITLDASGNATVVGTTGSLNFPTTPGAVQRSLKGFSNAFVTKLSADGTALGFSTYLGGGSEDHGTAVAVDDLGNTYITGYTSSADFPTTSSASQATLKGSTNAFVAKLKAGATALVYASYFGGSGSEQGTGIAVDRVGNIYLTGYTKSADLPATAGAYQTTLKGDANVFVAKISFPATHYQINMPPSSAAGTAFTISVTALDDTNTLVRTYTGTIHFTSNDPQAILPADYTFTAADAGVHLFTVTLKSSGSRTVTTTDKAAGTVTGTGIMTITPLAPVSLMVGGFPSPATAGAAGDLTVSARDQYGNIAVSYTGTVTFSSSDAQAVLPADYTFTAADNGVHTFSITLKTAGTRSLSATDKAAAAFTSTQSSITVIAAAAASLTAAGFPATATAGAAGNLTLTFKDPYGNMAVGYRGTIHFSSSDAQAGLPLNYTFTAADNGVHTFSITLKTAGTQSLTATDTAAATLSGSQRGIVVNAAAAASLTAAGFPGTVTAGTAGNWTVTLKDPYGNLAAGYTGTLHFSSSDPQAALPGDYTFTAADKGSHTFSVALKTAGTQSLQVTDKANAKLIGTQSGITVNAAAFSKFVLSGFPSPATAGTAGSFTVTSTDDYGNSTPNYTGAIHFTSSDARAVLPPDYTFVVADHGVHTFSATFKTAGTQTLKATDKVNANFTGTESVPVNGAAAVTLLLAGIPSPAIAGTPANATVTLKDAYGNVANVYTGTVHFSSSDARAVLPADYTFTAADTGVHTFSITLRTVGTQSLKVADKVNAALTATQTGITVNPGAASVFVVAGFPSPISAGRAGSFTVTAQDSSGNVAIGYTATVHFSSSDGQAVLPANYTFTAADHGVHTFSATLKTAGSQAIIVTDTQRGNVTGSQTDIQVTPLTPSNLAVVGFPSSATAGTAYPFTVRAVDIYGNTAPAYTGSIHITSSDSRASLPADYTFTAVDRGAHVFSATFRTAATQFLKATDKASANFTSTESGIVVTPAAASTMLLTGLSSPRTAGTAGNITISFKDAFGNTATGYRGTVHLSSSDAQAALPGDYTFTATDTGAHTFGVILKTAGTQSLQVADKSNGALGATQSGIAVNPAATATLTVTGFPGSITAGTAGNVTVIAKDAYGNTTPAYTSAIHFTSSDTQAALPADYTFTAADHGVHTFSATLKTAGTQFVKATDKANANIAGTESGIIVNPAAPAALTVAGLSSPRTAGTAGNITVIAKDAFGNTTPAYRGTVTFSSGDAQAGLPANYVFTAADNGVHTFSVTLKTAGTQSVKATDRANAGITGTQSGIVVNPAATATLAVTGFPASVTAGTAGSVTVAAKDAYGNTTPAYTGAIHFSSSDAQAALPGDYTFTAADQGVHTFSVTLKTASTQSLTARDKANANFTGTQSGIVVHAAAASSLLLVGLSSPRTAGVAGSVTVTLKDAYGNVAAGYTGTVHFSSSDAQAALPADYPFTAADKGVHTFSVTLKTVGTQSFRVADKVNGTLSATQSGIVVTPAAVSALLVAGFPASITAGVPGTFTVTAKDAFGNTVPTYTGTVHFTSSDPQAILPADAPLTNGTGTFSATLRTTGTQALTAADTQNSTIKGSQTGIRVNTAPSTLVVAGFPTSITAGVPGTFTVTAKDRFGNTVTTYTGTVHFSSSDRQAALPADYIFTAADQGSHTFSATLKTVGIQALAATDTQIAGLTGSQTGIMVNPAAANTLAVSGFPASITAGTAGALTVTAKDAYGNLATGYTGTVTFASTDDNATLPDDYTFTATDAGVHTFAGVVLRTARTHFIIAYDTANDQINGVAPVHVIAAAVDHFIITTTAADPDVAGTPFDVTVTAQDVYGNTATGYTGTITFSSQDPFGASLPADYTFTTGSDGDNGVHTFVGGATLYTAGTWDATITDTQNSITAGAIVNVVAAAADHFQVTTSVDGGSTVAGTPFDVTITAQDAYGNTITDYSGTVTFSSQDPYGASLPADYTFTTGDNGVHTFAGGATLFTAGIWDVTATDSASGITGSDNVTVTPAAADHFDLVAPAGSVAGQAFDVAVLARDPFGNIDTNYQGTVTFAGTDAAAVLPGDYTFTAADAGMHVFAGGVTLFTAGSQDLSVTDTDSGITGTANVTVSPAAADHFVIVAPAQVASGQAFEVTVLALDPYGNIDVTYQGTVHFDSTDMDPGVVLPADYTFGADDQGVHTFAAGVTLITAGDQTLTVTDVDSGITGSATVTVTDAGGPRAALQGPGPTSTSGVTVPPRRKSEGEAASHRPEIAYGPDRSAVVIDSFFHRMSQRLNAAWWTDDELFS